MISGESLATLIKKMTDFMNYVTFRNETLFYTKEWPFIGQALCSGHGDSQLDISPCTT